MKFALFVFIFLLPFPLLGSDSLVVPRGVIKGIVITGNIKTKDYIITREMSLGVGDTVSESAIEYDRNRIYSLRLFNKVDITPVPMDGGDVLLHVGVDERWYIFPYPILGIKDRDWSKIFYGAGILHDNFLGENQKLFAQFAVGYDPFVELNYRNPWCDSSGNVFFMAHAYYSKVHNRSVMTRETQGDFNEQHYVVESEIGRRFGNASAAWLLVSHSTVSVSSPGAGRTISSNGTDRYLTVLVGGEYDTRNLKEYPSMGTYLGMSVIKYGLGTRVDYWRIAADARRFIPVHSFATVGFRGFANVAMGGSVPLYDHVYFGYSERIRGHFKDVLEGESIFGCEGELHVPILNPIYFRIPGVPIEQFTTARFGIVAAIFADAGQTWFRGEQPALPHFTRGYGAGIHFLLPYSGILRTEVAFNEHAQSQFIIDLGAAF